MTELTLNESMKIKGGGVPIGALPLIVFIPVIVKDDTANQYLIGNH